MSLITACEFVFRGDKLCLPCNHPTYVYEGKKKVTHIRETKKKCFQIIRMEHENFNFFLQLERRTHSSNVKLFLFCFNLKGSSLTHLRMIGIGNENRQSSTTTGTGLMGLIVRIAEGEGSDV